MTDSGVPVGRRALLPPPALPLVHLAGAHAALATACLVLVAQPGLPGGFHYHPRLIAVLHLVTLGWVSGTILGAIYIVAPLVLGLPLRAGRLDAAACAAFWIGGAAMVRGFWTNRFALVGVGALLVLGAIAVVGVRVVAGLGRARLPLGVKLPVGLAFGNIGLAGILAALVIAGRLAGWPAWPPLALAQAHGHLAVLGWAAMAIVGIGYRLIPMVLPAAMPSPRLLWLGPVLLEAGTLGTAGSLAVGARPRLAAAVVVAAFALFLHRVVPMLRNRRPRPVELPRPDWATAQVLLAMGYLVAAIGLGTWLAFGDPPAAATWVYGVAGILGFAAQMVAGVQGRLLPLHAWYAALARLDGRLPTRSVHRLNAPRLALAIAVAWLVALPMLAAGLAAERSGLVAGGATALLVGTTLSAVHAIVIVRRARA